METILEDKLLMFLDGAQKWEDSPEPAEQQSDVASFFFPEWNYDKIKYYICWDVNSYCLCRQKFCTTAYCELHNNN